jgi:hypothetical protein
VTEQAKLDALLKELEGRAAAQSLRFEHAVLAHSHETSGTSGAGQAATSYALESNEALAQQMVSCANYVDTLAIQGCILKYKRKEQASRDAVATPQLTTQMVKLTKVNRFSPSDHVELPSMHRDLMTFGCTSLQPLRREDVCVRTLQVMMRLKVEV